MADQWLIRTVPAGMLLDKHSQTVSYYECGTDGSDLYMVTMLNEEYQRSAGAKALLSQLKDLRTGLETSGADSNALRRLARFERLATLSLENLSAGDATAPKTLNQAVSEITEGALPIFRQTDLIAPIWLALCSGRHFANHPMHVVPRLFAELPAQVSRSSNVYSRTISHFASSPPFAPKAIVFVDDGVLYSSSRQSLSPAVTGTVRSPSRWLTNALYEASGFRHYAKEGLSIPSVFHLTVYCPTTESGDTQPKPLYQISGSIKEVNVVPTRSDFRPAVSVVSRVQDNRFVRDRYSPIVPYFVEPGRWPAREEVRLMAEYQRAHDAFGREHDERRLRRKRVMVVGLLCILVLVPLAWQGCRLLNYNTHTKG